MLLTQRQSIKKLRAKTGMSLEWCETKARAMAVHPDGKRMKVLESSLETLIYQTNHPEPTARPKGVRPFSQRKIDRIRERCI